AEALEVRFLANRDRNLRFALLTDFFDADTASLPDDAPLLQAARSEIECLNARYAGEQGDGDVFFLFHRSRLWNPREGVFMGEERKRGKLGALNVFLRSGTRDAFIEIVGDTARLQGVRYVITLDTDTQLPRDAARELVGTLAHPLNRAAFDEQRQVIARGYGILQPRVGVSMGGRSRSLYARLFGSEPGIDPYTRAVSDVYQDVFGEGSFVGKGIYDIDAFEAALAGRMPDNRILSHDLLEGCYARAGLVSDVQLYEDYPARYAADVKRRHRWIRGDWQVLPWILPWVPRAQRGWERNPLSMLSRGKLADNLRRSLVPAAITALLLFGWLFAPWPGWWTLALLSILWLPPLLASLADLARRPSDLPWRAHLRHALAAAGRHFAKLPVLLATLPYEAFFSLDAILRTLWRMTVSRRHLLQWSPSSEVERTLGDGPGASIRTMWPACVFAIAVAAALLRLRPDALIVAAPLLLLWALSPLLMTWLGRARSGRKATLSPSQSEFLARLARRTWGYFEAHVTQADHWLPPDNVQEHPVLVVARRTSPTNIGLGLLADLAAWDFGYLPGGELLARCGRTLATLRSLPRHRGHFYNWYDTQTLQPLPPRYVSTVDSGNLAGHLLTLRQGLLALADAPLLSPQLWAGLQATAGVLSEARAALPADPALHELQQTLHAAIADPPQTLSQAASVLDSVLAQMRALRQEDAVAEDAGYWTAALQEQVKRVREDLHWLAPWLADGANAGANPMLAEGIPTLGEVARWASGSADFNGSAEALDSASARAQQRIAEAQRLAAIAADCAQMDFGFLYDRARHLLSIGYNVEDHRLDPGYYDLLASEARLCSFVGIAQGQLPQDTWFALGRLLTEVDGDATLLSWSGSMFEYLMPQLVMPTFEGTLLDETARNSVQRQIDYGRERDVPWGMSESGYNIVDARMNYQYRAFGVPGLGLKRGLAEDLVIAPYASMMAAMVMPEAACENLQRLTEAGFAGRFGMYEAIDYTAARLPRGQDHAVIRSFMAHHQGMGLLSLLYVLREAPMQRRFLADPQFQATVLL
ncbi:MAG TPA: glucoamylase family protein, partial [Xanthomonadaceae bacterium]|nr:glucoamylase family protein [Xanthomonadaceae bacterium]